MCLYTLQQSATLTKHNTADSSIIKLLVPEMLMSKTTVHFFNAGILSYGKAKNVQVCGDIAFQDS